MRKGKGSSGHALKPYLHCHCGSVKDNLELMQTSGFLKHWTYLVALSLNFTEYFGMEHMEKVWDTVDLDRY